MLCGLLTRQCSTVSAGVKIVSIAALPFLAAAILTICGAVALAEAVAWILRSTLLRCVPKTIGGITTAASRRNGNCSTSLRNGKA